MALWMLHESKKCMGFCINGALFDHGVCTRIPNCRDTDGEMQMRCKCGSEVSSKDNGSDELLDSLRFGFNLKLIYWFDLPTHSPCLRCMLDTRRVGVSSIVYVSISTRQSASSFSTDFMMDSSQFTVVKYVIISHFDFICIPIYFLPMLGFLVQLNESSLRIPSISNKISSSQYATNVALINVSFLLI